MYYGPIKLSNDTHVVEKISEKFVSNWNELQQSKKEFEEKICKAIINKYGYPHGVVKEYHRLKEKYVREESGLVLCEIELHVGLNKSSWNFKISKGLTEFMK